MRRRHRIARPRELLADHPVGVEPDLPEMVGVAVRPDRELCAHRVEVEDLDVRRGLGEHVRDRRQAGLQARDRIRRIDAVVDLRETVDAAIRGGRVVLQRIAHQLAVAHQRDHVVGRDDRRGEQAELAHGALDAAAGDVVADLEGAQHHQERAGREVRQQARPGGADREARGRQQCGERGRLEAEKAQDADHQHDVQHHADDRREVALQRGVDLAHGQRGLDQAHREADQPAAGPPQREGAEQLEAEVDDDLLGGV